MKEKVYEIFREIVEWDAGEEVNDEMSSKTVEEWDSLVSMQLILQLEKAYQVKFEYDEIIMMDTIGMIKAISR